MLNRPRIFISAVSRELGTARQKVAAALYELGYDPIWQENFTTDAGDLRGLLRSRIKECQGVFHLVGKCYGSEPPEHDETFGRVSYTQYEALYARSIGRPIWVFLTSESFSGDLEWDQTQELEKLQNDYRKSLSEGTRDIYYSFNSLDQLELATIKLRSDLQKLRKKWAQFALVTLALMAATVVGVAWLINSQGEVFLSTEAARKASESTSAKVDSVRGEVGETREAAMLAAEQAESARKAAEGNRGEIGRVSYLTESESARQIIEAAAQKGDRAPRGLRQALEFIVSNGETTVYENATLDGVNFSGAKIPGASLSGSSLREAELSRVVMAEGALAGANLSFATFSNADFSELTSNEAVFEFTTGREVSFSGANLKQSSFFFSDLRGANFRGADLRGACLAYCDLTGADFRDADLTDAIMHKSVLNGANLEGATIQNLDVSSAVASGLRIHESDRAGLCRSAPEVTPYHLDLKIWGASRNGGNWDGNYPDINGYYLLSEAAMETPLLVGSLRFRTADALNPVGAYDEYAPRLWYGVRLRIWFRTEFWEQSGREERIEGFLSSHSQRLAELLKEGSPIEGDGSQLRGWMETIESNSRRVSCEEPITLDADSALVLMLSRAQVDLGAVDWNKAALIRARMDAENIRNSWSRLYPEGVYADFLPPEHVDFFKKWTMARAQETVGMQRVVQRNRIKWENWLALESRDGSQEGLLFFGRSDEYDTDKESRTEINLGLGEIPGRARFFLERARDRYTIAPGKIKEPLPEKFYNIRTQWLLHEVEYSLVDIDSPYEQLRFHLRPELSKIYVNGNLEWSGFVEMTDWIEHFERVSTMMDYSSPLHLNTDSLALLMASRSMLQFEEEDWQTLMDYRIRADSRDETRNWSQFFPSDAGEVFLPNIAIDYFKRWTEARIDKVRGEDGCSYRFTYSIEKWRDIERSDDTVYPFGKGSSHRIFLPFLGRTLGSPQFYLDRAPETYGLSVGGLIDDALDDLGSASKEAVSLTINFSLLGMEKDSEDVRILLEPIEAEISVSGEMQWSGSFD